MNVFVLSELESQNNHVGWLASYDIENTLVDTCNATIISPQPNNQIRLFKRYRQKIFQSWFKLKDLPTLGAGPNVLLAIGMGTSSLRMIPALGSLVKKFDVRLAYLFDLYEPQYLDRQIISQLDRLFIPIAEITDKVNENFPGKASFLPHAFDVLTYGSDNRHRCIDITSYGRRNPDLHQCLQKNFNQPESPRFYFHSTFSQPRVDSYREHRTLLAKLLAKSQISLCFEPSEIERFYGYSPVLTRWFEGWAAGCTIVGKRPFGKGVEELIGWTNSTIEIPDTPSEWIPFFEEILGDKPMLQENTVRNYRECLLRHDWRYRIKDMLETVGLPLPENLQAEIGQLKQKANELG